MHNAEITELERMDDSMRHCNTHFRKHGLLSGPAEPHGFQARKLKVQKALAGWVDMQAHMVRSREVGV